MFTCGKSSTLRQFLQSRDHETVTHSCYSEMITSIGHMSCCSPNSHWFSTLLWVLLLMVFVCWVGFCTFAVFFLLLCSVFMFGKRWWFWCPNGGASALSLRYSWLSELVALILIYEISDTGLVNSYEILPTLGPWVAWSCYSCHQARYILLISGRTIMLYSIWFMLWP